MDEKRKQLLLNIAKENKTPVFIVDLEKVRENYRLFKKHLPRVQAYYAVKANPDKEIIRALYSIGASFDVASFPEFMLIYENIKNLPPKEQQDFYPCENKFQTFTNQTF